MDLNELLHLGEIKDIAFLAGSGFFLITSLIQIAPIKFDPWTRMLRWAGKKLTGDLRNDLNSLIVDIRRQTILTFARECRNNMEHSAEEWAHVLNVAAEYEKYCADHKIVNGVINEDTRYIRGLYQELSRDHKIS